MIAKNLLSTARLLAVASPRKPKQADLRRAISTAYYALFHALAADAANLLVGQLGRASKLAWAQTYRALDHGVMKSACAHVQPSRFPATICAAAGAFLILQQLRHDADYDPMLRFTRAEALEAITMSEKAILGVLSCETMDRRALAVLLLLKRR